MQLLEQKKALITGGTSGIGLAIAKKFISNGASVTIVGTNEEKAKRAIEELNALKLSEQSQASFILLDVADNDAVQLHVKRLLDEWSNVDILVNCAGITRDKLLMRMEKDDWEKVIQVNLNSVFNFCKALMRPMIKNKQGRIINISSVIGLTGNPGQSNYAASKAGMIGFSKSLAKELATRGITVNVIAPGFIETPMTDRLDEKQQQKIFQMIPMSRFGSPEEVANVAVFLASDLASYITGEVIAVDGGMLA